MIENNNFTKPIITIIWLLKPTFNPWTEAFRDDFLDLFILVKSFGSWVLRAGWDWDLSFLFFLAAMSAVLRFVVTAAGEPVNSTVCSFGPSLEWKDKLELRI